MRDIDCGQESIDHYIFRYVFIYDNKVMNKKI